MREAVRGEDPFPEAQTVPQGPHLRQDLDEGDQKEGAAHLEGPPEPGALPDPQSLLPLGKGAFHPHGDDDEQAVETAPGNIAPACPMPEARGKPGRHQSYGGGQIVAEGPAQLPPRRFAQTLVPFGHSHGVVDVVFEPDAQADMPAPPVFGDGLGKVGPLKVLCEPDAKNLTQAAHDVHVAGEVGVDLGAVAKRAEEDRQTGIARIVRENLRHVGRKDIGNHHLLEEAPDHPLGTEGKAAVLQAVFGKEFAGQIPPGADGPLGDLREEGRKKQDLQGIFLGFHLAPVDVAEIAHGLEGVERDAQGDDPADRVLNRPAEHGRHGVDLRQQEVDVLEGAEDPDVQKQAQEHHQSAPPLLPGFVRVLLLFGELLVLLQPELLGVRAALDVPGRAPDCQRGQQQERQIQQAPQSIEPQTEGQQDPPLEALWQREIYDDQSCEKQQERNRQNTHFILRSNAVIPRLPECGGSYPTSPWRC